MRPLTTAALAAVLSGSLALGVAGPASARNGLTYTRDLTVAAKSAFVFRGAQRGDETFKINGELRFNGIHAGATFLQPVDTDDYANEARFYGAWSPHIEDRGSPIDVEFGFTYYITPDAAPGFPDDARFEPYGAIFFEKLPLMPSLHGFYDFELETFTVEGRASHFMPLGGLNGLDFTLDAGHVTPDDAMEHSYAQGGVDLVRNFLNGVEGYVGVRGTVSSEDTFFNSVNALGPVYDRESKVWVTAGVTATF